jgi:hypothetical protein
VQEIHDQVDASDRFIAVVGPAALTSDYVRAEWNHARLFSKVWLRCFGAPVMRSSQKSMGIHGPDFMDDSKYEVLAAAFARATETRRAFSKDGIQAEGHGG